MKKLEPCSFCKNNFNLFVGGKYSDKKYIYCDECNVFGPNADTEEQAKEKWDEYQRGKRNE